MIPELVRTQWRAVFLKFWFGLSLSLTELQDINSNCSSVIMIHLLYSVSIWKSCVCVRVAVSVVLVKFRHLSVL